MTREDIEKKMHEAAEEIKPLITTLVEALCEAHQKGYLAGVELGAKIAYPHWIPVEERLPEETEVVLGVREGGTDVEMYKFMGFNESTNTFDWEWHPYYRAVVDDVTHWMPIVPPRKEDKI